MTVASKKYHSQLDVFAQPERIIIKSFLCFFLYSIIQYINVNYQTSVLQQFSIECHKT